ncbi:hypothetical protein [Leptospira kmetyi]|uniref:hypothetical protein n=1 Tax=Leptospira kmetyi TaxID=408139 RepID=UPI0010829625|nr:hypothetical protein [Leptospira kmetyi]TGK16453.1 hypothetical protein EHO62_12005 [Leptospira kmetyi]TGK34144.1 hypothetical protein EHO66_01930 [Leptospira kmetyi]
MKPKFSLKTVTMDEEVGFTAHLVLVPISESNSKEIKEAIVSWTKILKDAEESVLSDPVFEESDPWFGFGVTIGDRVLTEQEIFSEISKEDEGIEAAAIDFIKELIRYNKNDGEGLVTHEELETGTYAMLWLLEKSLKHLDLYLKYLGSLDLDHMVAQLDVLFRIVKLYSAAELEPLKKFSEENYVQQFNNWFENDRAWKN